MIFAIKRKADSADYCLGAARIHAGNHSKQALGAYDLIEIAVGVRP
ncbi:hypothetical protein [Comamonas sp. lk]|nr:hypothetical protein [Comamonas sp. lk]